MADERQVAILKQGGAAWNAWRRENLTTVVNLSAATLSGADLSRAHLGEANLDRVYPRSTYLGVADLRRAHLLGANLSGANLSGAHLFGANLSGADLSRANLSGANLFGANLSEAHLGGANLNGADLSRANLSGAILYQANPVAANLRGANLGGCDLHGATFDETVLADVDLSGAKDLESTWHRGPSPIDIRTLQRSGPLPLVFLRGVGLPDKLIEYLPSLLGKAIQFYSCFISYSTKDEEFAWRLHADLQGKGVRCWFAPHDLRIGDKHWDAIDDAIRHRDKLLLILSEASIASEWVEDEVNKAFAEERRRARRVLFPVRVDDAVFATNEAWASKLRDSRHIGDFRGWKDHDAYQKTLVRLLRDLRVEST